MCIDATLVQRNLLQFFKRNLVIRQTMLEGKKLRHQVLGYGSIFITETISCKVFFNANVSNVVDYSVYKLRIDKLNLLALQRAFDNLGCTTQAHEISLFQYL